MNSDDPIDGTDKSSSFDEIYKTHYLKVYYWVKKMVISDEEAEDLTAEIFIRLWRYQGDSPNNISAFLYTTAKNAVLNYLITYKRRGQQEEQLRYLLSQDQHTDFPEDLKLEVITAILKEIERLPASLRTVFKLAYIDGLKNEEISERLGISNQSVRNAKHRATQLLRIKFRESKLLLLALIWILNGNLSLKDFHSTEPAAMDPSEEIYSEYGS